MNYFLPYNRFNSCWFSYKPNHILSVIAWVNCSFPSLYHSLSLRFIQLNTRNLFVLVISMAETTYSFLTLLAWILIFKMIRSIIFIITAVYLSYWTDGVDLFCNFSCFFFKQSRRLKLLDFFQLVYAFLVFMMAYSGGASWKIVHLWKQSWNLAQ